MMMRSTKCNSDQFPLGSVWNISRFKKIILNCKIPRNYYCIDKKD